MAVQTRVCNYYVRYRVFKRFPEIAIDEAEMCLKQLTVQQSQPHRIIKSSLCSPQLVGGCVDFLQVTKFNGCSNAKVFDTYFGENKTNAQDCVLALHLLTGKYYGSELTQKRFYPFSSAYRVYEKNGK